MSSIGSGSAKHRGRRVDYQRRRLAGTIAVVAIFFVSLGGILTLALAIYPLRSGGFPVVPRPPYIRAYDPITLVELGLPPNRPIDAGPLDTAAKDPEIRLMAVRPEGITLLAGGRPLRTIDTPVAVTDIGRLRDLVADRDWIEQSEPGKTVVKAALITYPGVDLAIGGPTASRVALLDRLGVFLGTHGGGLHFDGVRVHPESGASQAPSSYRPFILAIGRGTMRLNNSTIDGLGWDWNGSYGVSWQDGSTGEATDTTFENNFIGVYTARSPGLIVRRCTFRRNHLYGFDPHTYSKNIVVEDSVAEENGAHGFIFSEYVRQSRITNSIARGNGENGITMDKYSTGNLIEGNTVVGNKGDGIVTTDSPRNLFQANVIQDNRVGVRTSLRDAGSTRFEGNEVLYNNLASENLPIANGRDSNTVVGNGGQWDLGALRAVWVGIAAAMALSAALLSYHARNWVGKAPGREDS